MHNAACREVTCCLCDRFGPWVRAWGVQDGDTLGLEMHGGDPCQLRAQVGLGCDRLRI